MKKLIIVNGTMGVGKSTVCQLLLDKLKPGVYLDGDWCWNMNPFIVSDENKAMVLDNIVHLLKNYLSNSGYKYVIFCWVIHQEVIFSQILEPLKALDFELYKISLVCSEAALRKRLEYDVQHKIRNADVINRSVQRLPLYDRQSTVKIDVTNLTPQGVAEKICNTVK